MGENIEDRHREVHVPVALILLRPVTIGRGGFTYRESLINFVHYSAEAIVEESSIGGFHSLQGRLCG